MKIIILLIGLGFNITVSGQNVLSNNSSEKDIREKVLNNIQVDFASKNIIIDSTIIYLDTRVDKLDSIIKNSQSGNYKADRLLERVQIIEDKQRTIDETDLNVYQANYQSAIINLLSMDREIKPLILFNSSRDFFVDLTNTTNPVSYPGYQEWYEKFRKYIEGNKAKDVILNGVSNLITLTGDISKGSILSGPFATTLFSGIASFVNSLGGRQRELRAESEKMFLLTMTLSQFTSDNNLIENEWIEITKQLKELQNYYDTILDQNLELIHITKADFYKNFTNENDAHRRLLYLNSISQITSETVANLKISNPKNWKEKIFYEMMDAQAIKIQFGQITFKISENNGKYNNLITKYRSDALIGKNISDLEAKLNKLKSTFDDAFMPLDYIKSAARMYIVK